ncbi:MAG: cytochrome c oxidase subunit II [Bacteroidetes bacterium GWF2_49_14]|nr:MAG: cytochrome c oxidase subunit II [Bacteroidetes bacterium GWF2_49_14]HBB90526.1 cytochrome c oxidase subunit II [Bacteroidales bacterium]
MFEGASNLADGVDRAFVFIFSIAAFFIIGITAFMIWVVIRYNRKKGKPAMQFTGNNTLEVIWIVIPLIIVMAMFYFGWIGFAPMRKVPADAMKVTAIGRMWEWSFDYGNGKISKIMVVPADKPVRVDLHSVDVNHSFFVPAFRVKEDVIPGYDNFLWFSAFRVGEYDILCTEYCGLMHSAMMSSVKVVPEAEFIAWLDSLPATGDIPDPEGLTLLKNTGCIACHTLDGIRLVGPSFKGFYGKTHTVVEKGAEKEVVVNEEYLRSSILEPNKQVVKGFNKGLMQPYGNVLSEDQIKLMVEYLMTLKD